MPFCFQLKYSFHQGPHSMLPWRWAQLFKAGQGISASRNGDPHFSHNVQLRTPLQLSRSSVKETLGDPEGTQRPGAQSAGPGLSSWTGHVGETPGALAMKSWGREPSGLAFLGQSEDDPASKVPFSSGTSILSALSLWSMFHVCSPRSPGKVAAIGSISCGL